MRASASTAPGATRLFERDDELGALSAALGHAAGGDGALVLVQGPAGIGKSRLLAAACDQADQQGMTVLRARGVELEREVPFGVAGDLFAARLAAAQARERGRLVEGQARLAVSLFDPAASAAGDPHGLVRALYWLTVNFAHHAGSNSQTQGRPVVIVIDDVQWSDRPSLRFLVHLASRLDDLSVALILAARRAEPGAAEDLLAALRS